MQRSESLKGLGAALAKAQAQIKTAAKDAAAQMGKGGTRKYADLASVWAACRDALTANGLSVVQGVSTEERHVVVSTMLLHESGEWVEDRLALPIPPAEHMNPVQVVGSTITYGRRYGLAAMVGVAPDDDDDSQSVPHTRAHQQQRPPQGQVRPNGHGHAEPVAQEPMPVPPVDEEEPVHVNPRGRFFALWQELGFKREEGDEEYCRFVIGSVLSKLNQEMPSSRAELSDEQWTLAAGALRSYMTMLVRKGLKPGEECVTV